MMRYPVSRPNIPVGAGALVLDCLRRNWVSAGLMVKEFERLLADTLDVDPARVVTTTSGTTALHLALVALGVGPGDEVLVPDLTYVATANAVLYTGARPVFVDVDPRTYCMDVERAERALTKRTKVVLPVHLYGQACDMRAVRSLYLPIIEDAAEGLFGTYLGERLGTISDVGCFSFFGNKLITTGEGGACVARDAKLAAHIRSLGGMCNDPNRRYNHLGLGFNYRMTDLQAAVGIPQLQDIYQTVGRRREIFGWYQARLKDAVTFPVALPRTQMAPWLVTCQLPADVNRDTVMALLTGDGIETRPTFVPMHEIYGAPDWDDFPVTNAISQQGISLPTYVGLSQDDVDIICDAFLYALVEARCA
jgi:perosamine synthetase